MNSKVTMFFIVLMMLFSSSIVSGEDTEQIQFGSLPDAVKKTATIYVDEQQISKITKISDESHVKFKIETDKVENNKNIIAQEILIASSGKIMKLVQEVPYYSLSFEQMNEIEKRYLGIKVDELESVQKHYFDVLGTVNGQKVKFRIFADGQIEKDVEKTP